MKVGGVGWKWVRVIVNGWGWVGLDKSEWSWGESG